MKKKDVLEVMTSAEAARVINRHQSQITIMGSVVPERFRDELYAAVEKRKAELKKAMKRLEKDYDKWKKT